MNNETFTIDIAPKDLAGMRLTGNDRVIDKLAYSAGQWTEDDLYENNIDYDRNSFDYIIEQFDFENALLAATKTKDNLIELAELLDVGCTLDTEKTKLQAGAYMALKNPGQWRTLLQAYEDKSKEDMHSYNDSDFFDKYNPELKKELQDSVDDFWKDMHKEWLYGDHRDYAGVVAEIAKYWTENRDRGSYDEKADVYTFTFDLATAQDELENEYDRGRFSKKAYKEHLIQRIKDKSNAIYNKDMAEREKKAKERKEQAEHEEKRKAEAEAKRIEKLKKLTQ